MALRSSSSEECGKARLEGRTALIPVFLLPCSPLSWGAGPPDCSAGGRHIGRRHDRRDLPITTATLTTGSRISVCRLQSL